MNEFRQGWGPLFAATIGTMCGLFTITNYSQGFFVGPVISELGWTSAQFFLSYTILMCVGMLTGPLIGSLASRVGIRKIGIVGLIGHALAYIVISLNNGSLLFWYASFALLAVLGAGSLPIIWTSVLNGWFRTHRGKAIGITMAGTGIGAFLLPPIVEFIIANYGWRTAYRSVGVGVLLLSLPIVIALFKENTRGTGPKAQEQHSAAWGLTRPQAMQKARFWILGAVLFVTAMVLTGLLSNFERIMTERALERSTIAAVAAVLGLTVIAGRILVGALVDRFWAPAVAVGSLVFPIVALLLLINVEITFTVAIMIGIMIGLAAGAELDLLSFLTSKYFGSAHYPAIFGAIFAFFTVGAGIAPPLYGAAAQAFQGYTMILSVSVGLFLLSMVLYLALGKYPDEEQAAGSS